MIIDKLGIKKSNFAIMTKELELEGLVVSKQGEIDKRCRLMFLTEKGKKELETYLNELISNYWFIDSSILNENIYYALEGYLLGGGLLS